MNKKNWKWLALALVLSALLTGCASGDTPTEPSVQPTEATEPPTTAVPDTTPPLIDGVADLRCYLDQDVDLLDGITITDALDPDAAVTVDDSKVDWNAPGTYEITYTAVDSSGNEASTTAVLTIIEDNTPPAIYGVTDRTLCVGSTIAYRSGILVTDDTDDSPKLSVDSSGVDLSTPGTYPLLYRATDAAGNVTTREVTVTVHEKVSYYVEESVIYAEADRLLEKIITGDMTARQQVEAIYAWTRENFWYNSYADKSDWKQSAYQLMQRGYGDCFSFFSLSKLLFERLGIPNIDVRRMRLPIHTNDHFWNMVSVDGGETWYYYDATPFPGQDTWFCLVTDAELDAFSYPNNSYFSRDRSSLPSTPLERP